MKATKLIAVVYDQAEARQTAVGFCDGLISRFWEQFEFDISWWSFEQLESGESAQAAAKKAATADIVVFSTSPQQRVPERFQQWIELWLPKREEHEGVLVNLFPAVPPAEVASPAMSLYLRSIAHRAGMDYLTGVPEGISHPIPESLDSCTQRAEQVTTLLDEILHSPLPTASMPLVY